MIKNNGIIIFTKKIKENDLFIKVLSSDNELVSGMVYGGNSTKKKQIYQIGYFIEYSLIQKNNTPAYFNAEISKPFIYDIIQDKYKSYSLLAIISLINLSIVDGQKIKGLFTSIKDIINILISQKHWISFFCQWLFILLEIIGYQIDYKNNKNLKYYNLINQEFIDTNDNNDTIVFPHKFINGKEKVSLSIMKNVFKIFENNFTKNHLDNINYNLPEYYIAFKNSIIEKLK